MYYAYIVNNENGRKYFCGISSTRKGVRVVAQGNLSFVPQRYYDKIRVTETEFAIRNYPHVSILEEHN